MTITKSFGITMIDFYWDDLTKKAQNKILKTFEDNMNWDTFPFCTLQIEDDEEDVQ